jgi:hypothetical protein
MEAVDKQPGVAPPAGDIREFNNLVINEAHIRWFATIQLSHAAVRLYVERHAAARKKSRQASLAKADRPRGTPASDADIARPTAGRASVLDTFRSFVRR